MLLQPDNIYSHTFKCERESGVKHFSQPTDQIHVARQFSHPALQCRIALGSVQRIIHPSSMYLRPLIASQPHSSNESAQHALSIRNYTHQPENAHCCQTSLGTRATSFAGQTSGRLRAGWCVPKPTSFQASVCFDKTMKLSPGAMREGRAFSRNDNSSHSAFKFLR